MSTTTTPGANPPAIPPETILSIYEVMGDKSRKQIIDAWMEDKLCLQGQVRRLQATIREIHDTCKRASIDVVLENHNV